MAVSKAPEPVKPAPKTPPVNPHRLEAPYGYYTDDKVLKHWGQGFVVSDPEEIQHLKERGARLVEVKP